VRTHNPVVDYTGFRNGKLTALELADKKSENRLWRCRCDCGVEWLVQSSNIPNTRSCGCVRDRSPDYAWKATYKGRKSMMLARAKVRAKARGIECTIGHDDFEIPEYCPVLGIPLVLNSGRLGPDSASLDRIDLNCGYVPGNVQVISNRANAMKSDASPDELLQFAEWALKTFGKRDA
jgi:hypothetical protein